MLVTGLRQYNNNKTCYASGLVRPCLDLPDLKHILAVFAKILQKLLLCLQLNLGSDDYCPARPAVTANFTQRSGARGLSCGFELVLAILTPNLF